MTRSAELLRSLLPLVVVTASACGGGGGGGSSLAPSPVALSFPAEPATTDAETLAIRGAIALAPPIEAVTVNGFGANTSDGFATFAATIPLSAGARDVVVEVTRPNLPAETFHFPNRVRRVDPIVSEPDAVVFDAANSRLLLLDRAGHAVVAVDPKKGERTMLSDRDHGVGPLPPDPVSVTVDQDGAFAFVVDEKDAAVFEENLANGDRLILSGAGIGSGSGFVFPQAVAFDRAGKRLLVADPGIDALVAVDVKTGARTIFSDASTGTGPGFGFPMGLAIDPASKRAFVADAGNQSVIAVDLATGNRTKFSDASHGTGDDFETPGAIALDTADDALLVVDLSLLSVVSVDLATGNRTTLVQDADGTGTDIGRPVGVAADANGTTFVIDASDVTLVRIDSGNKERENLVALPAVGSGPSLDDAGRVAFDPANRIAWVATFNPPAILRVDLATGTRTTFSDATHGRGTALVEPRAIALDAARGRLLVADDFDDSLRTVSLRDGSRGLLSIEPVVPGDDLHFTREIVLDDANSRALLIQSEDLILAVDLASGARSEFSFDDPNVINASRMDGGVLDAENGRLLVHDQSLGLFAASLADGTRSLVSAQVGGSGQDGGSGLAPRDAFGRILITPRSPLPSGIGAVEPATGNLVILSSSDLPGAGVGPVVGKAVTLAFDAERNTALVYDQFTAALFEFDLVSGDRVLVSR